MCDDYSLIKLSNRIALEGEELVAHRFRNGSIALVPRPDFCRWQTAAQAELGKESLTCLEPRDGFWQSTKSFFREFLTYYGFIDPSSQSSKGEPGPVVAIPSDALLRVFDIALQVQLQYHLDSWEDALFIEASQSLCFGNGATIPLKLLREGQKIKILRRSWADSIDPAPEPIQVKV